MSAAETLCVLRRDADVAIPEGFCLPGEDYASSAGFPDMVSSAQKCPICLNPITGEAFLDPCFHSFCYHCILQWAEMVFTHPSMEGETFFECPLCKTHSSCIIHNIFLDTFQRHYLCGALSSHPFSLSQAHYQRLYIYRNNLHSVVAERLGRTLEGKRKSLHISGNENVQQWLRRELQALMQEEDVELITQHVLGVLEHYEKKQEMYLGVSISSLRSTVIDAVKPFLFENAEAFCGELQSFLTFGLTVKAYDLLVQETSRAHTLEGWQELLKVAQKDFLRLEHSKTIVDAVARSSERRQLSRH